MLALFHIFFFFCFDFFLKVWLRGGGTGLFTVLGFTDKKFLVNMQIGCLMCTKYGAGWIPLSMSSVSYENWGAS
jgi:hypothetical protein